MVGCASQATLTHPTEAVRRSLDLRAPGRTGVPHAAEPAAPTTRVAKMSRLAGSGTGVGVTGWPLRSGTSDVIVPTTGGAVGLREVELARTHAEAGKVEARRGARGAERPCAQPCRR